MVIAAILCALFVLHADAFAQRAPACDSTVAVQNTLAENLNVRTQLADWMPAGAVVELIFEAPKVANRKAVSRALIRSYPVHLRDSGRGGEVYFAVLVDTMGVVADKKVTRPSEYPEIDRGAEAVISQIRFEPVRIAAGCAVPAMLRMPIVLRATSR